MLIIQYSESFSNLTHLDRDRVTIFLVLLFIFGRVTGSASLFAADLVLAIVLLDAIANAKFWEKNEITAVFVFTCHLLFRGWYVLTVKYLGAVVCQDESIFSWCFNIF